MLNRTQDKIYETFVAVARGQSSSQHSIIDASERIAKPGAHTGTQIRTAKPVKWRAATATTVSKATSTTSTASTTGSSTQAVVSTVLQSVFQGLPLAGTVEGATNSSGGGIGSTIESIASTVLKSGLGMVPLLGGLLGLFGGSGSTASPALTKYVMPSSIAFEGADAGLGASGVDYDQMGRPRAYGGSGSGVPQPDTVWPAGSSGSGSLGLTPLTSSTGSNSSGSTVVTGSSSSRYLAASPITTDPQAIDARWFLDRSADIAAAVREAMLNSNSINDVVSEL